MEFDTKILENNDVIIDNQFIGKINGLKLELDLKKGALETDIKSLKKAARQSVGPELEKRIKIIIEIKTKIKDLQDEPPKELVQAFDDFLIKSSLLTYDYEGSKRLRKKMKKEICYQMRTKLPVVISLMYLHLIQIERIMTISTLIMGMGENVFEVYSLKLSLIHI